MSNAMRRIVAILGIIVGLIIIFIGLETTDTYISTYSVDSGIRFGADFYTEIYDVTSDVGKAVNYNTQGLERVCEAIGWLIFSIGALDVLAFTYLLCSPRQKVYKKIFSAAQADVKAEPVEAIESTSVDVETADA